MSWTPTIVDEQGWAELTALLLRAMQDVIEIQKDSAERLIAKDAKGISCTVSILGYPSANEERKVGPPVDAKQLVDLAKPAQAKRGSKKKATAKKAKAAGKGRTGKEKGKRKS